MWAVLSSCYVIQVLITFFQVTPQLMMISIRRTCLYYQLEILVWHSGPINNKWWKLKHIYKRHCFNFKFTPDIDFKNEVGIDGGGLSKEFFYLVLTKLRDGDPNTGISLFEGAPDHIVPIHCSSSLDSGRFHLFGKILAHSILQGGIGFIGMAPAVAKYIATKSIDEAATLVSIEDIPDLEYRDYAQKVLRVYFKN